MTEYIEYRPHFSPRSCYLLRDQAEADYFTGCGGAPEAALIAWARMLLKPDDVFIDVGAHVGTWAQDLAQHCEHVYAFEPQRPTFTRLLVGVGFAGLRTKITCSDRALGDMRGPCTLSVVSVDGGGSTMKYRTELGAVLETQTVGMSALDCESVAGEGYKASLFPRVGLIKIDVEGNEAAVIRGATRLIREHRPHILAEAWLHDWYRDERRALREQLEALEYTVDVAPGWPEMLWAVPK